MSSVELQIEGPVARLRFNRPEQLNALDIPTARAFAATCRQLAADRAVRAVVLSGAGRGFGVGGDLTTLRDDPLGGAAALIDAMHEGVSLLAALDAPVIAALHGPVAGGSMSLALCCDLRVAATSACFNFAYSKVGTSCDVGASWALPRLVGLHKALEIALLSEPINAAQALALGLVHRVVEPAALDETVDAMARQVAAGPTCAYGEIKRLMRVSHTRTFEDQLEAERAAFLRCAQTRDFSAAMSAFFAKQHSAFKGL